MSIPARAITVPSPEPSAPPHREDGPWSDLGGVSPALSLQRRLAREWQVEVALPAPSGLAARLETTVAAMSRIGGPILFGATLAAIASVLT